MLPISMAFQPIVDMQSRTIFAREALVRDADGAGAAQVLAQVDAENAMRRSVLPDQGDRVFLAPGHDRVGVDQFHAQCGVATRRLSAHHLATMRRLGVPCERIIFEVTEHEIIVDQKHLRNILHTYRAQGFRTAIDDFGAGYAGLNLLADSQPDLVNLYMALIRGIDTDSVRRIIVEATLSMCERLDVQVIAEGVETVGELRTLQAMGIRYFQGYLLARPAFEALCEVNWPAAA